MNDGVVRPGESVQVNLVRVDETHVFKHAEDALQTQMTGPIASLLFLSLLLCTSNLFLLSVGITFFT